jgi:3-deoxy-D-manno-octulosonic-acid transferase
LTGHAPLLDGEAPCAWFHGVSVGEVILLGQVVQAFQRRHPDWTCVISTTTETGFAEACKRFAHLPVFYWPFDFSWAVRRALRLVKPSLVVLAEGELWPNFLAAVAERAVPVTVINGRMSPRNFRFSRRWASLVRPPVSQVDLVLAQTQEYAQWYRQLGVSPQRVRVTGSVKYDGVNTDAANRQTRELRSLLTIRDADLVWIAGSTQEPEEEIILTLFQSLRIDHPNLRLFVVPRQKERFEQVAALIQQKHLALIRRSRLTRPLTDPDAVVLVDTIGELGALWALADVAFVGGSLDGRRGGQNMIEPAAYGAAVVFGPHVWNFKDAASRLLEARAALQVNDALELGLVMKRLLQDPTERQGMGDAARQLVKSQQGATARTVDYLSRLIESRHAQPTAA